VFAFKYGPPVPLAMMIVGAQPMRLAQLTLDAAVTD
jgi:hypothetical protein